MSHRLSVPVESLQGDRIGQGMSPAQVEQPIDGLQAELCDKSLETSVLVTNHTILLESQPNLLL